MVVNWSAILIIEK